MGLGKHSEQRHQRKAVRRAPVLDDLAAFKDDRPIQLLQRPGPQSVLHEQNPVHQVHLFAEDITGILERVAPAIEVIRMAAKAEVEIAEMLRSLLERRRQNLTVFVKKPGSACPTASRTG